MTGTDELCCLDTFSCPAASGGPGAYCVNLHCCKPNPKGGDVCLELEFDGPLNCAQGRRIGATPFSSGQCRVHRGLGELLRLRG